MFEIGASLRDARVRQGRSLPEIEHATKIRARYLRALEDEEFGVLPSETYVKGFLRAYADHLGLDGQPYVDEYVSRYLAGDEWDAPPSRPRRSTPRRPSRRVQTTIALVGLVAIALVTALVIAAWRYGDSGANAPRAIVPVEPAAGPSAPAQTPAASARPRLARLTLAAVLGSSWVSVHVGSSTGRLLYEGTLQPGQSRRFAEKTIWVTVGQPDHLRVHLNGNKVALDPRRAPTVLLATPGGVAIG